MKTLIVILVLIGSIAHARGRLPANEGCVARSTLPRFDAQPIDLKQGLWSVVLSSDGNQTGVLIHHASGVIKPMVRMVAPVNLQLKSGYVVPVTAYEECN